MKVLVIGHLGMLGSAVLQKLALTQEVVGYDIDDLDITDQRQCQEVLAQLKPEVIVNCAAFTAVDAAEQQREAAFQVNASGPQNLAKWVSDQGTLLIHISTDYIFDGQSRIPYTEEDIPHPLSVYGQSKWAGEENIRAHTANHIIIRTSWLYGPGGPCFPKTILKLAATRNKLEIVDDQEGCPTYAPDLAAHLGPLLNSRFRGTLHITNAGSATWYSFARAILTAYGQTEVEISPTSTSNINRPAPRPAYSVLDTTRFVEVCGQPLRAWNEALQEFISLLKKNTAW